MHKASSSGHAAVVQSLLQHGADVAATNQVGAAGVPLALAWRCARECLHAMFVRAKYAWRCVHAIVRVCVAVPRQQRAAR